jgi:hypothetical protein
MLERVLFPKEQTLAPEKVNRPLVTAGATRAVPLKL